MSRAAPLSSSASASFVLALLVVASAGMRLLAAFAKATPTYMPDEFLYSDIARSIATEGRVGLRGEPVAFPALLEPLLAAPAWLADDVEVAYRLTQGLHAVAVSAAAIPAYLLVRTLRGSARWGLGAAALAVAVPGVGVASFLTADAVAYPLALAAVLLWVRVAPHPTIHGETAFVAVAALATFARVQYVALFLAAGVSGLVLARLRIWRFPVLMGAAVIAVAIIGVVGPARTIGPYSGLLGADIRLAALGSSLALQLAGVVLASLVVLVPGAIAGVVLTLIRPGQRGELAFASFAATLAPALVLQAALVATTLRNDVFMERYVLVLPALCVPALLLAVRGGRAAACIAGGVAALLSLIALRAPVSTLSAAYGPTESQLLRAVSWLESQLTVDDASLLVSLVTVMLSLVALAVAVRPRLAPVAICAAIVCGTTASVAAHAFDVRNARTAAATWLAAGTHSWVDDTVSENVTLLATPGTPLPLATETAFWNRSLRTFAVLDGVPPLDHGVQKRARILRDGTITVGGRPLAGAVLTSSYASTLGLVGARLVRREGPLALYDVGEAARVEIAADRGEDGWLAASGHIRAWPTSDSRAGWLVLRLRGPGRARRATVTLRAAGYQRAIILKGDESVPVRVPVRGPGAWTLRFSVEPMLLLGGVRPVGVRASMPTLLEGTPQTRPQAIEP